MIGLAAGWGYANAHATPYCPWQHRFSDLSACAVLDERDGRVLLQHADLDSNIYYIEIRQAGDSTTYDMPAEVTQLAPQGYSAKLTGTPDTILFNGRPRKLKVLTRSGT